MSITTAIHTFFRSLSSYVLFPKKETLTQQTTKRDEDTIQEFFKRFPQYRKNDFYVSSESYGGHYLPSLSKEIVDRNAKGEEPLISNFKGFAVGNAYTNFYSGIPSGFETLWGHQLVSKPTWDAYQQNCVNTKPYNWTICEPYYFKMQLEKGNLDLYGLSYPVCNDPAASVGRTERIWQMNAMLKEMKHLFQMEDHHLSSVKKLIPGLTSTLQAEDDYEPCRENFMTDYLQQESVRQAIHVNMDIDWKECANWYLHSDQPNDMTGYYNYLIDNKFGLNILVFSGDDDYVCSTFGTQSWIWNLGYEVSGQAWQEYFVNNQTAGYVTKWKDTKLAFATVRGAGHMVPAYKPEIGLDLFSRFLRGELTNA